MRQELLNLFHKYPFDKEKNKLYLDILKTKPNDRKTKELLTMNFLAMAYKIFCNYLDDDLEVLYFLNEAFTYAYGWWEEGKGFSFETAMSNALKNQLDIYIGTRKDIYIPRHAKDNEEVKTSQQYIKLDAPIYSPAFKEGGHGLSVSEIIEDPNSNFETDFEFDDMCSQIQKYKEYIKIHRPTMLKHFERFQAFNKHDNLRVAAEEMGVSHECIAISVKAFEKDFIKYLKHLKIPIHNDTADHRKTVVEEHIYVKSILDKNNKTEYTSYRVSVNGVLVGQSSRIDTARKIRDEYLSKQKELSNEEK